MSERRAMIEPDGKRFYSRIYYSQMANSDWMGAIFREPNGPWELDARHRLYRDNDKTSESKDEKLNMGAKAPDASDKSLLALKKTVELFLSHIEAFLAAKTTTLELDTADGEVIFAAIMSMPQSHMSVMGSMGATPSGDA